jgi:hypothetical protein
MFATPRETQAYWVDAMQRSVLYLDVLRERGNQFLDHYQAGKPPVLSFDYDVVLDGATLPRPCNYMLLRIRPPADAPAAPGKRPFVVFDPRAGHGPGIGGMKEASQVGVAMRAGHPVYFVSFRPHPEPGQTLRDVAMAEKAFLDRVTELHPDADARPAIVGNCQAGWAIMALSAYAPEQSSVIAIAGAPLSYWAGVEGRDPMRYFGGLLGGNWSAAMLADLGAGTFDGVNLVVNFENLNPANTLLGKPYNLYSKIDTERERFLGFERWWGGYFLMTKAEIIELTSELFIGNKLTAGRVLAADGTPLDLRAIRAPIVVICSEGDNITPPAQALNWILDLYSDVDEIRANEQTIVYTVHPTIGHLGIFVSAKVALKEHAEMVNSLELIESLPPGLYEMVVEEVEADAGAAGADEYRVRFEARDLDDIRRYDDGRADEAAFRAVARLSEANEGLYETFVGPWLRALSTGAAAEAMRALHPSRQAYALFSDANPWMHPVKAAADLVRANRAAAPADNPLRAAEAAAVAKTVESIEAATRQRDQAIERMFKAIFTHPVTQALAGEAATHADGAKPATSHRRMARELARLKLAAIAGREEAGSFAEAVLRILCAGVKAAGAVDARGFAAAQEAKRRSPRFATLDGATLRREMKEAALMVAFDEERALEALPRLLPTPEKRREAVDLVREIAAWRPEISPEVEAVLRRVEGILGLGPEGPGGGRRALPPPDEAPMVVPTPAAEPELAPAAERPAAAAEASARTRGRAAPRPGPAEAGEPAVPAAPARAETPRRRAAPAAPRRRSTPPRRG